MIYLRPHGSCCPPAWWLHYQNIPPLLSPSRNTFQQCRKQHSLFSCGTVSIKHIYAVSPTQLLRHLIKLRETTTAKLRFFPPDPQIYAPLKGKPNSHFYYAYCKPALTHSYYTYPFTALKQQRILCFSLHGVFFDVVLFFSFFCRVSKEVSLPGDQNLELALKRQDGGKYRTEGTSVWGNSKLLLQEFQHGNHLKKSQLYLSTYIITRPWKDLEITRP